MRVCTFDCNHSHFEMVADLIWFFDFIEGHVFYLKHKESLSQNTETLVGVSSSLHGQSTWKSNITTYKNVMKKAKHRREEEGREERRGERREGRGERQRAEGRGRGETTGSVQIMFDVTRPLTMVVLTHFLEQ